MSIWDIAPLHGTMVQYRHLPWSEVVLVKPDHSLTIVNRMTFNELFFELDGERAALKEDCIRYAMYVRNKPLCIYPEWFIAAYDNGAIYEEEGYEDFLFYCEYGDIVMSHNGVVLRNYKGELTYMEYYQFIRYYEIIGGCQNEC